MTTVPEVSVAETVRWLHDEGLVRLAGVGGRAPSPVIAYSVEVATGMVTAFPDAVAGPGTDVLTLAADDLPYPSGSPRRLVVVGVTASDAVLVLDLEVAQSLGIYGDRPEITARAWVVQLLLDPQVSITTNCAAVAIAADKRCQHVFIPGGGTVMLVDDSEPPVSTVRLNPEAEGSNHLDVAQDRTADLYLGSRFWQLRRVLGIEDPTWAPLVEQLENPLGESDSPFPPSAADPEEQR
ncbi:hypothetical protein [Nocardia sp. NBC_00511]|uniref:hypothetical protein n=1 Tax=Nocardia sp. NBC_00511 TaxID=2903591 RepID=UPI002F919E5C